MTQQTGATGLILLGFESSYGVPPSAGYILPVGYGENLLPSQGSAERNLITSTRNPSESIRTYQSVEGSIPIPVDSVALVYWLIAMFGDPTTTGSDPYTHEFKIGSSMPSIVLEKGYPTLDTPKYCQLRGMKVSGFSIAFGEEGALEMSISFIGAQEVWGESSLAAAPTTPTPAFLQQFEGAVEEAGASADGVTKCSIDVGFGLDTRTENIPINSQGVRSNLPVGKVSVKGSVSAQFNAAGYTMLQKGVTGAESSLKLTYGSGSSIFELEVQELTFDRTGPVLDNPEGLIVQMAFNGHYTDGGEASAIVARITNSVASYNEV